MKRAAQVSPIFVLALTGLLPGCSHFSKKDEPPLPPVVAQPSTTDKVDDWSAQQASFTYMLDPSQSDVARFVRTEQYAVGKATPVTHIRVDVVWEDSNGQAGGARNVPLRDGSDSSSTPIHGKLIRHTTVHFDIGRASVHESDLQRVRDAIKATQGKPHHILIEGHTDSTGSVSYNKELSERRAWAVRQKLIEHGENPNAITLNAYGETRPIAPNHTPEGRARNRRAEVRWYTKQPSEAP